MFTIAIVPLLVPISREIPMTLGQLGILGAAPLIIVIFVQLLFGVVVDRHEPRAIIIMGRLLGV